jgi:curli biogenesis system outer membrane secretion channel CsgG
MFTFSSRLLVAAVALLPLVSASPAEAQARSSRPTVAVLDLDFAAVQRWWEGNWDVGKGVADLIVDELVNDGTYRIIERKRLDAILAEQNFSNSDRAEPDAATVAKMGKMLGVKYLMVGSLTKFGTENKKVGIGGGGWGGGILGGAKVGTSKGKANVAVTMRIIDTSTGEILASAKGEGISSRSGVLLGGGGGGWGGGGGGEISMGSSDFRETILGEATDKAVKDVVAKLVAAKDRLGSN